MLKHLLWLGVSLCVVAACGSGERERTLPAAVATAERSGLRTIDIYAYGLE